MTRLLTVPFAATLAALAVLGVASGPPRVAGYEALLVALGVLSLRWLAPPAKRSPGGTRRRDAAALPAQLERLERAVLFGTATALDADRRLLPPLRTLADARLQALHGVSLTDTETARELLGAQAFALLRPDRPRSRHADASGLRADEVLAVLSAVERLPAVEQLPAATLRTDARPA